MEYLGVRLEAGHLDFLVPQTVNCNMNYLVVRLEADHLDLKGLHNHGKDAYKAAVESERAIGHFLGSQKKRVNLFYSDNARELKVAARNLGLDNHPTSTPYRTTAQASMNRL